MSEILHWIGIDAPPERVFKAVTTAEGLSSWWTSDVQVRPEEGSTARFGFNRGSVVFRMRVDELDAPGRVRWTCLGDVEEWEGTEVEFRIHSRGDGSELFFTHAGWRSEDGAFRQCNTDWGRLMYHLKDYVEGRSDRPMMS